MTDEYEALMPDAALWRHLDLPPSEVAKRVHAVIEAKLAEVWDRREDAVASMREARAERDSFRDQLAEVRAEVDRHKWNHQQSNELIASMLEKWEAEVADRDRTIAEQAAELAKLRESQSHV